MREDMKLDAMINGAQVNVVKVVIMYGNLNFDVIQKAALRGKRCYRL